MKDHNIGVLLVILGALSWASSGVMAESLFKKSYSVEWVNLYRLLFSGLFLAFLSFSPKKMQLFTNMKEFLSLLCFSVFGLLLAQFAYFKAIFYIDAGTATMIQYSAPLFIMLFLCVRNKILPRKIDIFALILLVVALFFLAFKGEFSLEKLNFWGFFWGILGAFGVVYYSLGARGIIQKYGVVFVLAWASLIDTGVLWVLVGGEIPSYAFNLIDYGTMLGIIFVGTILAFSLYLKGLERVGALQASMIACIEPVAAAVMTCVLLGTKYSWLDIAGFVLILFAVFLNTRAK